MKSKVWAEGMIGKPKGSRAMLRSSSMHKDFMPGGGLPGRPAEQVAGDFTSDSVCWQRPFGAFAVLELINTQVVLPVLGAPSMPTLLDMAQTMTKVRPVPTPAGFWARPARKAGLACQLLTSQSRPLAFPFSC